MLKDNQKKYDGQNRCRRCDKPLSDPNDVYRWRCAEIAGLGGDDQLNILDDGELILYNVYISLHSLRAKNEPRGSFTTNGKTVLMHEIQHAIQAYVGFDEEQIFEAGEIKNNVKITIGGA